ncbi:DUF4925 domain-containing protein [Bacteroides congonensis]|uniref:DUF4925 domain-containing protein n=1 Tax=Bacteroides congonensis TaxID=1871006 RepID=UPI0026767492|nr:DUF4925 domain-containing protein [Bacteroides congonensis]
MKNKLFYLIGVATLLCSTSTFTSCINGVDDEYLELVNNGSGSNNEGDGETVELLDLNGDYVAGGELDLVKMMYNGEELTGKTVNVAADEMNQTATITLTGTEQDLTEMLGGLMEFKFTTFSPVPGVKEITLPNVKLYNSGTSYLFKGELIEPTYTLTYEGTIEDGKMNINLKHELVGNNPLAGTWDLAAAKNPSGNNTSVCAPLWLDWDSNIQVTLGFVMITNIKGPMNGIFSILTGVMSPMIMNGIIGQRIGVQPLIRNLLKGITAEPNGCMFATYSYSGDFANPAWSSEMPHNAIRYYYNPEAPDSKIYLEANVDFLIKLIGDLINPAPETRTGNPEATKELGRQLITLLTPLMQAGIPCDYVIDENGQLIVNIDSDTLKSILSKLLELANDEYAKEFIEPEIGNLVGADMAPAIMNLLRTLPYALKYKDTEHSNLSDKEKYETDYDPETFVPLTPQGECGTVKLGFKFVKAN